MPDQKKTIPLPLKPADARFPQPSTDVPAGPFGLARVPAPTARVGDMSAQDAILAAIAGLMGAPTRHTNDDERAIGDSSGLIAQLVGLLSAGPAGLRGSVSGMRNALPAQGIADAIDHPILGASPRASYHDAAAQAPDMFQKGPLAPMDDFHPDVYKAIKDVESGASEGFSLDPRTGVQPSSGHAVAIDGETLSSFDPASVRAFILKNRDVLSRGDVKLGGWLDSLTKKPLIELSRVLDDPTQAERLAKLFDQKAVFDLGTFNTTETGGADVLKNTKGKIPARGPDIFAKQAIKDARK